MSTGYKALAALLIALALVTFGYRQGSTATHNAWQAKEGKRIQEEKDAQEAEFRRADKASGALQAELLALAASNDQLHGAFDDYKRKHPLLARRPVGRAAPAAVGQAPPLRCEPVPGGNDSALSLGAVWMWNSALAGRDVPAGACGLADTSPEACAADSGRTLTDAWDNQALNAKLCAEDRLRHQRLIDFLQERKQ
jgi:hypothetical protein